MYKKPVIVFEGIEGSGKTFHINSLANFLKKKKIKYIKIREPGGTNGSEKIRNLILSNNSKFDELTDLLLYAAARNENYVKILKKNYKKKVILIDRFIDSTIAYQHFGMKIDLNIINYLNSYILNKFKIDHTFLNIVNKDNLLSRLKKRKKLNRYDKFNYLFYKNVQEGFLKQIKKKKNKSSIINSNNSKKINKLFIQNKCIKLIGLK